MLHQSAISIRPRHYQERSTSYIESGWVIGHSTQSDSTPRRTRLSTPTTKTASYPPASQAKVSHEMNPTDHDALTARNTGHQDARYRHRRIEQHRLLFWLDGYISQLTHFPDV